MTSLRCTLFSGVTLALVLTVFIDLAILVVPIYDMQLYDRVLMSRNMDTLTMLSISCVIGVSFYAALDFLRSATFIAIADSVVARTHGVAFAEGVRRAAGGDRRAGPELIRNINVLQTFVASGALAVPLDALCTPLFIGVLFILHPAFGWLAIVGICGLVSAGSLSELLVAPRLRRAQGQRQLADFQLSAALGDKDLLDGLGMLPAIAQRWGERYAVAVAELGRVASLAQAIAEISRLARLSLQAGVMVLGAVLVVRGQTTPGSLMGANLLLNKCLGPFDHLVGSCRSWVSARHAWSGVTQILSNYTSPEIAAIGGVIGTSGLLLDGVEVRLPDGSCVLSDITARIAPGQLIVLSGRNGSGKSTLLRVLAGVIAPTSGRVLLDGVVVTGGSHIGYLPQSVSLMDGSISENIGRLAPNIAEVFATAREVGVHEHVGRMDHGYQTHLLGDGINLSGGMRQRIGLARALYGSPMLLLLDEPDASLDGEGAAALLRAIRIRCGRGAIAIVISHRESMRTAADLTLELRGGRLVADEVSQSISGAQCEVAKGR